MSIKALITAIGSLSSHIVLKTLARMGWAAVGCDIYPQEWLAEGRSVQTFYRAPLGNNAAYMPFLLDIIQQERTKYVLPLTDIEVDVLSGHRADIEKAGAVLCLPSANTVSLCRNKLFFHKKLQELGLRCTIPTYTSKEMEDDSVWRQAETWIGKPVNGRSSEGLRKITSREQFLRILPDIDAGNYIFQPCIGDETSHVVTVDIIRQSEYGLFAAMPRRELLRTINGAGTTVEIFENEKLTVLCKRIADILDIHGCVNFEFIEKGEQYYILECNPRFSGGVEFSCLSGYDFVGNHLRCFFGERIDEFPKDYTQQIMTRRHNIAVTIRKGEMGR